MNLKDAFRILAAILGLVVLVLLKEVVFIAFLGILFCVILSFPVRFLSRWMPRGLAVLLTLLFCGGMIGAGGALCANPLSEQVAQLDETAPKVVRKIEAWFKKAENQTAIQQLAPSNGGQGAIQEKAGKVVEGVIEQTGQFALKFLSLLSGMVVIIVLAAFFAHEPRTYYEGLCALVPRKYERDLEELWNRLGMGLRHWVAGILISMSIMGVVAGVGLWLAGIQDWPLLALITFFGTFIPYVGAIGSAVPGLMLGLGQSTDKFFAALAVYLVVHIVEGYIVEPIIMRRAVIIRPAILLIWQLVMGACAGVLGIIVATPLLVCIKIIIGYLYIEKGLGKAAAKV